MANDVSKLLFGAPKQSLLHQAELKESLLAGFMNFFGVFGSLLLFKQLNELFLQFDPDQQLLNFLKL